VLSLPKVAVLTVFFTALSMSCPAQAAKSFPDQFASFPDQFASVLPEVKGKSRVPVFLPSELPRPIRGAKHAVVESASDNEYAISLYYELGVGDAGYAASFQAQRDPDYDPHELPNVRKVELSHGVVGYFRPVSCGGSCAPANIWWKDGRVLYQIQLGFPSTLRQVEQRKRITAAADSAILSGPR